MFGAKKSDIASFSTGKFKGKPSAPYWACFNNPAKLAGQNSLNPTCTLIMPIILMLRHTGCLTKEADNVINL